MANGRTHLPLDLVHHVLQLLRLDVRERRQHPLRARLGLVVTSFVVAVWRIRRLSPIGGPGMRCTGKQARSRDDTPVLPIKRTVASAAASATPAPPAPRFLDVRPPPMAGLLFFLLICGCGGERGCMLID